MPTRRSLVALVGAGAAATLIAVVPKFEGVVLTAAPDPVGIVTACMGDTHDVQLGQHFTMAECDARLEKQLANTAAEINQCTLLSGLTPGERIAFVDFSYNVGSGAYCKSSMARYAARGDMVAACAQLSRWVYAGGKVLPGLVKRRAWERAICEGRTPQ